MSKNIFESKIILFVILLSLLAIPASAVEPDENGYIADKPLSTFSHDIIKGGLAYTIGDSYYSGKLSTGETYTVHFAVSLPEGAVVKFARLYNYWTWSVRGTTGTYPDMKLAFDDVKLDPDREYSDRKGWGIYDYPTGTWSYNVTDFVTGSGSHTMVIENIDPEGAYFFIDGVGLLMVYTDMNGKDIEYWVNEGSDMLNSQAEDDGTPTFTTPDQTITEMMNLTISQGTIKKATLWTIVQSGNWDANRLWINGLNWSGICDGTPYSDLDVDTRDVTEHLTVGKNTIQFQAVEDYAVPSGSILVIEIEPIAEGASMSTSSEPLSEEASGLKETPGFEAVHTIALIIIISLLTFRKCNKGD
ncbi:MAG: DUF3344 domain-containing protein [ANME-2 cluster archaeon]|nr:MAG: DUF3344 domain-containing protein [ANME-2 cluster archaeon]